MEDKIDKKLSIKDFRVEPFMFLYLFALGFSSVTTNQLTQDKLCRNEYGQTIPFCVQLNNLNSTTDPQDIKTRVLTETTRYNIYTTIISTIPAFFWSLFVGSWTDKHIGGRKLLLCAVSLLTVVDFALLAANAFFFQWSPLLLLFCKIPSSMSGGLVVIYMCAYSYLSTYSTPAQRAIRFALLEACLLALPIGSLVGGNILTDIKDGANGQLRNYLTVFGVSLVFLLAAFVWVVKFINETAPISDAQSNNSETQICDSISDLGPVRLEIIFQEQSGSDSPATSKWQMLKEIVDLDNVKEVWRCCVKKRPDNRRLQIWLLYLTSCIVLLTFMNSVMLMFQYVQKVFDWNAAQYSTISSTSALVVAAVNSFFVPLFIRRIKLPDLILTLIGTLSMFSENVIRGSIPLPVGYFLAIGFGALGGVSIIGIRSRLSKIVAEDELGKIFSLLGTFESLVPSIGSIFFGAVFSWSIDFFPGLVFEIVAGLLALVIAAVCWMEIRFGTR